MLFSYAQVCNQACEIPRHLVGFPIKGIIFSQVLFLKEASIH